RTRLSTDSKIFIPWASWRRCMRTDCMQLDFGSEAHRALADKLSAELPLRSELAVHGRRRAALFAALLAARRNECLLYVAPSYWADESFEEWVAARRLTYVVRLNDANKIELEPRIEATRTGTPGVVVFTSGSTGTPKGVE